MAPGCAVHAEVPAGRTRARCRSCARSHTAPMSGHAVASNGGTSTGRQGKQQICSRKGVLGRPASPVDISLLVARLPCSTETEPHEPPSPPGTSKAQHFDVTEPQRAKPPRPLDCNACTARRRFKTLRAWYKLHTEQEEQAHRTGSWTAPHPPGSPERPSQRCPPRWPWSAGCSAALPGPRLRACWSVSGGIA